MRGVCLFTYFFRVGVSVYIELGHSSFQPVFKKLNKHDKFGSHIDWLDTNSQSMCVSVFGSHVTEITTIYQKLKQAYITGTSTTLLLLSSLKCTTGRLSVEFKPNIWPITPIILQCGLKESIHFGRLHLRDS